jgi:hypothetical protein
LRNHGEYASCRTSATPAMTAAAGAQLGTRVLGRASRRASAGRGGDAMAIGAVTIAAAPGGSVAGW